jgi:hypothetical protein
VGGGPESGEDLVSGLGQGRGCRGGRGSRGLGVCCVCELGFLEEVGVVVSGDRWWAVRLRGVRGLGLEGVDGRKGHGIVAEQLLLRFCWRCGLVLRRRVQLQLLSPVAGLLLLLLQLLVQLALLLLVLLLLLLLLLLQLVLLASLL